jgi:hypothetical protein
MFKLFSRFFNPKSVAKSPVQPESALLESVPLDLSRGFAIESNKHISHRWEIKVYPIGEKWEANVRVGMYHFFPVAKSMNSVLDKINSNLSKYGKRIDYFIEILDGIKESETGFRVGDSIFMLWQIEIFPVGTNWEGCVYTGEEWFSCKEKSSLSDTILFLRNRLIAAKETISIIAEKLKAYYVDS